MKRNIVFLIVCLLAVCSMAHAEIPREQIDKLSDLERSSLKAEIQIALITGAAGSNKPRYSNVLDLDLSEFSTDELKQIKEYLENPVDDTTSQTSTIAGAEICNYKLLTITVDSAEIKESKWNGMTELRLPVTISNGNDFDYEGCIHVASVNGWQVHPYCYFAIKGGLKAKEEIVLDITGIDVYELDDIENMTFSFRLNYAYYSEVSDEVSLTLK